MTARPGFPLGKLADALHERGLLRPSFPDKFPIAEHYTGVAFDETRMEKGDLWVNLHGNTEVARGYLREMAARGAAATVAEFGYDPARTPHLRVTNPRLAISLASALLHGDPSRKLRVFGITGTVGKSTTACMTARCLDFAGILHGLSSSAARRIGQSVDIEEDLTTPDAPLLHHRLASMVEAGASTAVVEVSSQGLLHERVADLFFRGALLTNMGREHDEFHPDFGHYCDAKSRLFHYLKEDGFALSNADSPWCRVVTARCAAPVYRYGFAADADLRAEESTGRIEISRRFRERFGLALDHLVLSLRPTVSSRHNLSNACGAAGLALAAGADAPTIMRALDSFPGLPGRGQRLLEGRVGIFHDVFERPALRCSIPLLAREAGRHPCVVIIAPRANRTETEYTSTTKEFLRLIHHHRLPVRTLILSRGRHSRTGQPSMSDASWSNLQDRFRRAGLSPLPTETLAPAVDLGLTRLRSGSRLLIFGEREPDKPMELIRARLDHHRPGWYDPAAWLAGTSIMASLRSAILRDP